MEFELHFSRKLICLTQKCVLLVIKLTAILCFFCSTKMMEKKWIYIFIWFTDQKDDVKCDSIYCHCVCDCHSCGKIKPQHSGVGLFFFFHSSIVFGFVVWTIVIQMTNKSSYTECRVNNNILYWQVAIQLTLLYTYR